MNNPIFYLDNEVIFDNIQNRVLINAHFYSFWISIEEYEKYNIEDNIEDNIDDNIKDNIEDNIEDNRSFIYSTRLEKLIGKIKIY